MKRELSVCLSTSMIQSFDIKDKIIVVVDIFRATSVICTALSNGVTEVIAVNKIDDVKPYLNNKNYLVAAERDGKVVEGFKFGNSPLSYINNPNIIGKKLVLTTTNGTKAINSSLGADEILIGSFLNLLSLENILKQKNKDCIIYCSGWKGQVCLEDTLFAGCLASRLLNSNSFFSHCDSVILSKNIYDSAKDNMTSFLIKSSYKERTRELNINPDIDFCLSLDKFKDVPTYRNGKLLID
ncbi:MAG: 2-phosphosulfolactate phosphatase [Bacteroidota bacterium]|nr:2-phosphosulfolactate phosphatase [Bacteroidota bacterium]